MLSSNARATVERVVRGDHGAMDCADSAELGPMNTQRTPHGAINTADCAELGPMTEHEASEYTASISQSYDHC